MRRLVCCAVLLLCCGCYDPQLSDGKFTCAQSLVCPRGFACVDGICTRGAGGAGARDLSGGDPLDMSQSDLWLAGLGDLDLTGETGTVEIDTDSGRIELIGSRVLVEAGTAGFRTLAQDQAVRAGAFSFRRVVIPAAITVRPTSSSTSALVVAASDLIAIDGVIDWRGRGALGGARTVDGSPASAAVGGGGKRALADGSGSGGGGGGGRDAGSAGAGASAGQGGNAYGSPTAVPLHVGAGGGGGGGVEPAGVGGVGGNGGGAVALLTLGELHVTGTIDVSGNDGRPGSGNATAPAGGGGGGSGGTLVLSAAQLVLDAGHQLRALGGAGGVAKDGGGGGGAGSVGRIWIGYDAFDVAAGTVDSTPDDVAAPGGKVTSFPR